MRRNGKSRESSIYVGIVLEASERLTKIIASGKFRVYGFNVGYVQCQHDIVLSLQNV